MLEGFVRQLILGYLGRYVKDIQKEQLKITLWNEEVLLENVELSLEAFDYLRLPFALKQGRVGKLSIKIPWMKLGWDPIVIILEDVFVCASQRDDEEWSTEAVGRREFAAKKARLAAAELAKLSKRMCDNRAGRLFTSYISAKILDNIQVSMRGFHVVYHDMRADSVHTVFGLKFSSLTIMKQNPFGSSGAKIRGGQVNKALEIAGLELYCGTYQGPLDILTMDNVRCKGAKCDSILAPCDVFMSLSVNRSGELDNNSPQHSINARITDLEISLDEVQLQQMFILWDYLCTSQLREKYGRFRPWCTPLSKKLDGWQKLWWHYAQESVLLDVRKKLKKTSWRYFGQRLSYRHKYVNLYKSKLYSLQQDQSIDVNVLSELEQMEKELDIDDILSYRSAAESKLQEFLLNSSAVNTNVNGVGVSLDKSRNDEHMTGKSRGWLNWLSLGMLGAGGTDDSSQFSGVVSDEVIKDIYEATEFHPLNTSNVDAAANDEIYFCVIKFSIHRISTVLHSMEKNQEIAQLVLLGSVIECKLWESSATIVTSINSGEMLCPCNKKVLLLIKTPPNENKLLDSEHPSLKLQIDAFPNQDVEFLVKGLLEPVEVTYDAEAFLNLMEFLDVFNSFESQHQRILSSLNGIKDSNRRLQLKAEYILSSYEKVIWDFCINNILINVPWEHEVTGQWNLVLKVGKVAFTSKSAPGNRFLEDEKQAYALETLNFVSNSTVSMCFQLQDLNDHIEVKIKDIEMMMRTPSHSKPISILEKFSSSIMFTFCIVPDESISKQLEVFISVSSLHAYFSPSIYGAVLGFISHICTAQQHSLSENAETVESLAVTSNRPMFPDFGFCVRAKFESVRLLVDLANDGENSLALNFLFQNLDIRYALTSLEECSICLKELNVTTSPLRGESDGYILYSSGNDFPTYSAEQQDIGSGYGDTIDKLTDRNLSTKGCFTFYYEYDICSTELASRKFTLWLNDAEIHCYPSVIRLMIEFFENISAHYASLDVKNSVGSSVYGGHLQKVSGFGFEKFGFSNYLEAGSPEHANIPLDHFPFVTISGHCSLGNLESSLLYSSPKWRKYYNLRDRRIRTQQSSARKDRENLHVHAATPKSAAEVEAVHVTNNLGEIASSLFDLSICGIRLHFHDSSSIIGTVTLPSSSSSLFVHGDYLEALCSLEGLTLTSLWWTKNPHEFLWGPSLPDLSPIINFRIRKKDHGSSSSHFELGVSFQHVYCLLPPEYLAIIIGYFSLPDWSSDSNENCKDQGNENADAEDEGSIVYKFETLDSVLILPVESMELHFLKVDIHQLYCSFVDSCSSDNALEGIPPQYWVPSHKLAKRSNCLNIFGRDLFLSFLSFKDNASGCLRFDNDAMCENITILAPLSADIWVRLPCENESSSTSTLLTTCIMARLAECQVLVEDDRIFHGVEALLDVINQFSLVPDLSQCFKSDVLQFLQMKGCFKENSSASSVASSIALTELRCHIDSLFIKFCHSINGSSKMVAKAEMQFMLSATLKDDRLLSSDLRFSSLELLSLPNSVVLARCTSPSSTVSVLDVSVWEGKKGKIELYLSFPSLDIWIHLSEWVDIIDTFVSYAGKLSKMSPLNTSSNNFSLERIDTLGNTVVTVSPSSLSDSTCSASENMEQESIDFTVKLENICITFHFPIRVSNKACGEDLVAANQKELSPIVSSDLMEGSDYRYVSVTMQSKGSELLVDGKTTKFKSKMEKWSGTITVSEDKNTLSWPLFQIFHVFVEAEISHEMMERSHVKVELRLDHLKVWLSHHFFYFWHGVTFIIPEAGSSQFPFGGIDFEVKMRKVSFLLSDGRWSCSGPLFEILLRNIFLHVNNIGNLLESLVTGEIQVNYNNIHKVFWEPFIEPWLFEINVTRKQELSLNSSIVTDIRLQSIAQLNLNFTEPLIECVFRTIEMIKGSLGIIESSDAPENQKLLNSPWKHLNAGRYAPYVLQNLTSLSLMYHVCKGPLDELDVSEMRDGNSVEPGASVPLHVTDTPEEQLFDVWPAHSSDRLTEQKLSGVAHHFLSIQLDGTSVPSTPISMDRVGLTYLEADFSKVYSGDGDDDSVGNRSSFVVPVVFDVSVQRYSKLIRIYSTVILSNATSLPLELRFDIPFGVAPMILDPIYPGQELPLPLHLAEAGRIRWRPIGHSYLWSEVYNLANLLSQETKVGFLKSFVCYPTYPSSDPFRCCISVRNISLPEHGRHKNSSNIKNASNTPLKSGKNLRKPDESNKQCVHHLTLHTPLVVKNYLPKEVSLEIESGGVTNTAFLSEVETFFHNVDPWHDLGLEIHMHGFKPTNMKFPRTEIFYTMAKFSGTKFTQTEIITFDPLFSNGSMKITVEKMMDALSGVRELYIYVPFLLYNCTGFPLLLSDSDNEVNRVSCIIPSSYDISEQVYQARDGLSMLSSIHGAHATDPHRIGSFSSCHVISNRNNLSSHKQKFLSSVLVSDNSRKPNEQSSKINFESQRDSLYSKNRLSSSHAELNSRNSNFTGYEHEKVVACIYSPASFSTDNELMVRVGRAHSEYVSENIPEFLWSSPFLLVPPSGSTTVLVPQSAPNSAYMISVTSSAVAGPLTGRSTAIIFQPRYIISNACSKDLCYKQKGTDQVFRLPVGKHSHVHRIDASRELLVSIRYNEPGWQWSGSFLPDDLGDTQVKMQNYVSGSSSMIQVEVQNADISVRDEKVVGSLRGNSGTILILLSDDDTEYMPYRIDNFSKERLRIFQQKCETFETIINAYTSCPYAWDEPCYPHRLTVEVPGERLLGSYSLDDVKEYSPICLQSSSEKPERKLVLSVHADGATKVLRVIDCNYHILDDKENSHAPHLRERSKREQKQDKGFHYKEKVSIVIPHLGISLINIHPQELLFACAKNITVELLQSLDQQKLSFQVSSLQIDNQLRSSPYPVMLSFDREYRSNPAERKLQRSSDSSFEPAIYIAVSKWRKKDISLVSFEYIHFRVADFRLELEQEVILSLFDFLRNVTSRFLSRVIQLSDPSSRPLMLDTGLVESTSHARTSEYQQKASVNDRHKHNQSLPSVVPIGAPWQQIYLLARRQRKIYVEAFEISPINITLSFSSAPWILRNGVLTSGESLIHRGLMALADVEGAQVHLKQLTIAHHIASWESIQEIVVRHFSRQLLHEMYKVFGSAGVIGNPMGFARALGLGLRDFLSVPARTIFESPTGLITGMAQGTTSLLSNTVYAISDAATQFSKAAHKGIVAFTYDDQAFLRMEQQQIGGASHSKGVINEVFEGLTGLLQLPIKGAEKHGLPGVLSGVALGVTGLVAKPAASILQVTGKTAQSIRNRSKLYQMRRQSFRVRFPRPLSREVPLGPYSWEEAVGKSMLAAAGDGLRFKDEVFVTCKALKQAGKFVVITERLIIIVSCSSLVDLGKPEFRGVPADLEWIVEEEIGLEGLMHVNTIQGVVHIVGSSADTLLRQNQQAKGGDGTNVRWKSPTIPFVQMNLELERSEEAESLLLVLLSTIEQGKDRGWGCRHLLHRNSIR